MWQYFKNVDGTVLFKVNKQKIVQRSFFSVDTIKKIYLSVSAAQITKIEIECIEITIKEYEALKKAHGIRTIK